MNRMKIKHDTYLKLAKIAMLHGEEMFDAAIGRTEIDIEFVERLPGVRANLEAMRVLANKLKEEATAYFDEIKPLSLKSRKDFALAAIKKPYKGVLFSMLDGSTYDAAVSYAVFEKWKEGQEAK